MCGWKAIRDAIFEANYVAGSKNSAGKSKSGRLLQNRMRIYDQNWKVCNVL